MKRRITIYFGEEVMAHMPSGQVRFLTFLVFIKLAWWALQHDTEIVFEESEHGK